MLKTMTTGEVDAADELETPSSEQAQPTTKIERTKPIMATYTTSCKPLPFYADGEAPLEELVDKFGVTRGR